MKLNRPIFLPVLAGIPAAYLFTVAFLLFLGRENLHDALLSYCLRGSLVYGAVISPFFIAALARQPVPLQWIAFSGSALCVLLLLTVQTLTARAIVLHVAIGFCVMMALFLARGLLPHRSPRAS